MALVPPTVRSRKKKKEKRKEAAAVEISVSFSFPRFAFSGGKKGKKDRSYNNYLRILLIIYDDDDDDIIYYTFNAYIFVYGQTIKKR